MDQNWFEIIKQTLMVSGFVLFMMLIIEYINVKTKGNWSKPLKKSTFIQISISYLLGVLPGCAGIFASVSLFTHNIINFSALLSGTIVSIGDEAFVMLALVPKTYLFIIIILSILAILMGFIFNIFFKTKTHLKTEIHFENHGEDCKIEKHDIVTKTSKFNLSFARAMLLSVLLLILFSQFAEFNHNVSHDHEIFSAEMLSFISMGLVSMFIILTVPEHFLMEHLWGHVIKKHFVRLFLWTLGSLIVISILTSYFNFDHWIKINQVYALILAIIVGILPISGPHIVFINLFISGAIPFSFLLANSVVQEGHAGIPLLAENKWAFVKIKLIKIVIAISIGLFGLYFNI